MSDKPKRKGDWKGRQVKTLRTMRNGLGIIPTGTICIVRRNYNGLHLETVACACCGVAVLIRGVPEHDVELLPVVEQHESEHTS